MMYNGNVVKLSAVCGNVVKFGHRPRESQQGGEPPPAGGGLEGGQPKTYGKCNVFARTLWEQMYASTAAPLKHPEAHQWPIYPPRKHVFPMGFERFHVLANLKSTQVGSGPTSVRAVPDMAEP